MARFDERATTPRRGPSDILRWKLFEPFSGRRRRGDPAYRTPQRAPDHRLLRDPRASATWIGHASWLARLGSKAVLVDPIFSTRAGGAAKRLVPPALAPSELPLIDVVCVTHDHFDHLDLPSIRALGAAPLYVVPLGLAGLLRSVGAQRIVELDWWESTREGDLEVTLVPARHWSMRMPWTRNESLWGGFVLRGPEGSLYHSGDTALFDGFREIGARLGPIDWALLPIGAYEPRWFMEPQHMDPSDAVEAFVRLGARHFFAMHWGTFVLTDEPVEEPPARLRDLWRERELDPERLAIFDVGESRQLGG